MSGERRRWYAPPMRGWGKPLVLTRRGALAAGASTALACVTFVLIASFEAVGPVSKTLGWTVSAGWAFQAYRYFTHAAFYTSPSAERPEGGA